MGPTREEALAYGQPRYWSAFPCRKHGHVGWRYTKTINCVACDNLRNQAASDRKNAAAKKWYEENKDRHISYTKQWRKNNPDKVKKIKSGTYQRTKIRWRVYKGLRRAIGRSEYVAPGTIQEMGDAQRWRCVYCRIDIQALFEVDHIVALSRGGRHERSNLQLLCRPCNRAKGTKDSAEFAKSFEVCL
jgi:5-methylcytosine-specific restriction endonuclease McrA